MCNGKHQWPFDAVELSYVIIPSPFSFNLPHSQIASLNTYKEFFFFFISIH